MKKTKEKQAKMEAEAQTEQAMHLGVQMPGGGQEIYSGLTRMPAEEIKKTAQCDDMCCPFHGKNSPRGRIFVGRVTRALMHRTASIEWVYPHFVKKYNRYTYKRSRIKAHNPPCINAVIGEKVMVMECRSISKTKHFVIIKKITKE